MQLPFDNPVLESGLTEVGKARIPAQSPRATSQAGKVDRRCARGHGASFTLRDYGTARDFCMDCGALLRSRIAPQ